MASFKKIATSEEVLWATRINKALLWRKKYSFENTWPDISRFYRHDFKARDLPHFNLIYMMGQTLIPNLVFQAPGILNTPQRDEMTFMASLWDSIDAWWINHAEIADVSKQVVLSSYLFNTTATQIGYDFGTEADDVRADQKEMFGDVDNVVDRSRSQNAPWVDFIPSHRFVVAVGTKTMRNCYWGAKLVSVPTSILKKQKNLKNVQATKIPEEVLRMEQATWEDKERDKWTHFWEIHDAESGKTMWLGTHGKWILPPTEDPLQMYGLPFEVTSFNTNPESIFSTPDAEYIRSQQLEGDELRMHAMYMRRLAMTKCVYNSAVIKPEDMLKMLSTEVCPAIPCKLGEGGDDDIRKHIFPFVPPTSLQTYNEYAKNLMNDAQLINGFGPNQLGNFTGGRHTKYETQVVESNNSTRLAYRRNQIAEMIRGHVQRANVLMSENWSGDVVKQVVGVDGALYWVKAGAEQLRNIKEGLTTEVNVESLAPVSRERRKMEATNLLGLLSNMQNAGMNTMPLIKQLLSTYEWIDVRQVLPQMSGEYELNDWIARQKEMVDGGQQGAQAAQNMQGLSALTERLPSENTDATAGGNDGNDRSNNS